MIRIAIPLFVLAASCSGASDAPRTMPPSHLEERSPDGTMMIFDDDADGVPNQDDACPLARAGPGSRDGCPELPAPDAAPW
jgi:hypothetical protein